MYSIQYSNGLCIENTICTRYSVLTGCVSRTNSLILLESIMIVRSDVLDLIPSCKLTMCDENMIFNLYLVCIQVIYFLDIIQYKVISSHTT